ncbi:hypothetical protein ACFQRB_20440 [Halobaculum litoreum]|uniref:Dolichyl-phosphate-mannose-protein mannosyltransferase n=1 Tax=Halobaculum litoreum TaxID=3031998 RepID=A0ABD5XSQ3_9EURY
MSDGSAAGDDRPAAATVAALRDSFPANVADADAGRVAAVVLAALGAAVAVLVAGEVFPFRSLNHDEGCTSSRRRCCWRGGCSSGPRRGRVPPVVLRREQARHVLEVRARPGGDVRAGRLLGGYTVALAGIAARPRRRHGGARTRTVRRPGGALAGVLLLATPLFVVHSGVFLPYMLTGALNVAFAVWYLRGERRRSRRDATLAGLAVGLAFFARPYTAVLFALPFVGHAVVALATGGGWRVPFAAAGVAAAGLPAPTPARCSRVVRSPRPSGAPGWPPRWGTTRS